MPFLGYKGIFIGSTNFQICNFSNNSDFDIIEVFCRREFELFQRIQHEYGKTSIKAFGTFRAIISGQTEVEIIMSY